jgi:hypothetical protein
VDGDTDGHTSEGIRNRDDNGSGSGHIDRKSGPQKI